MSSILVAGDYSQLEVRVAAFVSRDPILMRITNAPSWPDNDLHAQTMERVFRIPFGDQHEYPHIRVAAKTYFFGCLYGAGPDTIVEQIEKAALNNPEMNIQIPSKREAGRNIGLLKEAYAKFFHEYVPHAVSMARERGGKAETAFGRVRLTPNLFSRIREEREAEERVVVSVQIQGTAGDLVRMAMLEVDKIEKGEMLLQIHDEILSKTEEEYEEEYVERMRVGMELGQPLEGVPLKVDIGTGKDWRSCHK